MLKKLKGLTEFQVLGNDWLINVPSSISILQGSCVVIPCTYSHPQTDKTLNIYRAFWYRGYTLVATNVPELRLTREFHSRTRMTGGVESGNCTWKLDGARFRDAGSFYLKIDIPQLNSFSFSNNKVTLDIFQVPKPPVMTIEVRNKVTATCKVTHVCPTSPPHISWSRAGTWTTMSKQENKWLWSTTSTMTFTPQEADINKPVECMVTFHGRKTTKGSVLLTK
ncbi:PREDICTED: sialic acid-binding Ig-like lectin 14 [Poecilia mexicana]|uniref:sialic acid-binding Ig-like lectin 14 n=1 Tax=Poecilia mexicana TaxID=48701 RepID=UPI00072EA80F|nr:PREDICTED: sialic acid-binding Ig-like lectin 14 [Poecilia mexicana]